MNFSDLTGLTRQLFTSYSEGAGSPAVGSYENWSCLGKQSSFAAGKLKMSIKSSLGRQMIKAISRRYLRYPFEDDEDGGDEIETEARAVNSM